MLIGVWGAYGLARLLATPIKRLKEKMVLVQSGDLDVSVPNDDLLNCWEVLGCDMQDCPSFGKSCERENRSSSVLSTLAHRATP